MMMMLVVMVMVMVMVMVGKMQESERDARLAILVVPLVSRPIFKTVDTIKNKIRTTPQDSPLKLGTFFLLFNVFPFSFFSICLLSSGTG